MKLQFKKWNKIPQYRNIIQSVHMHHDFVGKDELDNPIYKHTSDYPKLKFTGTIKLHGTNAQITYKKRLGIQVGKRSSLIDQNQLGAHFGFNQFVQVQYQQEFIDWFKELEQYYNLKETQQLIIYGEWAGGNIQNTIALTQLPKSFYIFGVKILEEDEVITHPVHDLPVCQTDNVYNITDFPTYEIEIDFNNPKASQNKLVEITNKVEKECPVATQLGIKGIGEGVVWNNEETGLMFKVKGEKHSVSNVKTLAEVDPVVLQNIQDFASYVVTENRVKQAIQEVEASTKADTGKLLKWISQDIIAEETDVLKASGLEWRQVASVVSNKARLMFFLRIDKL
jgi:hypothetical protein